MATLQTQSPPTCVLRVEPYRSVRHVNERLRERIDAEDVEHVGTCGRSWLGGWLMERS